MWMCAHVNAILQEFRRNVVSACQLKKIYALYQHTHFYSVLEHIDLKEKKNPGRGSTRL